MIVKCLNCGKIEEVAKSRAKTYKTCSYKCMGEWYIKTGAKKGKNNGAYGMERPDLTEMNKAEWHRDFVAKFNTDIRKPAGYFSEEIIKQLSKKISERNKQIGSFNGEKNPWYGVSRCNTGMITRKIRRQIRERDNYICKSCGKTDSILHIHHIKPRRFGGTNELSNLISLCPKCHNSYDLKIVKEDRYDNKKQG